MTAVTEGRILDLLADACARSKYPGGGGADWTFMPTLSASPSTCSWCVPAGLGYLRIASTLNRERVPNPSGQDRRDTLKRTDQWSASGIKAILARELYRGKLVYGKTRNVHTEDGRKKVRGDKVVTVERPELRIIDESLWIRAHERTGEARQRYLRSTGGRLYGKPFAGLEGKHLLSGLIECGVCGGNMYLLKRSGKQGRPVTSFACSNRRAGRGAPEGGRLPEPAWRACRRFDGGRGGRVEDHHA